MSGRPDGFADAAGFGAFARQDAPASRAAPPAPGEAPHDARQLREVLLTRGPERLSDEDLAALLLGLVLPVDGRPLARTALRRFGSFAALLAAPQRELRAVPGLGTHGIAAIKLVHAAALRLARAQVMDRPVLDRWDALLAYLAAAIARERVEQFRVLFLGPDHRLLADEAQARGTVNHTPVYPREVVKRALELRAVSLILVHNHPSGDPTPSREDLAMTEQVREAAESLSIDLLDHVIVGNGRHLSFRREGLI